MTNEQWAQLVLKDAGLPVTPNNVTTMLQWMASENKPETWAGTAGANNPLNDGLGSGGGSGVGPYPDLTTAAAFAAKSILGGVSGMGPALAAFQQNAPPSVTASAIQGSDWASGHYGNGSAWHNGPVPIIDASATGLKNVVEGSGQGGPGVLGDIGNAVGDIAGGIAGAVPGVSEAIALEKTVETAAKKLTDPAFWERVGVFSLGTAVAVIGLVLLVSTSKTGQKAISEGAEVAPLAAVAA